MSRVRQIERKTPRRALVALFYASGWATPTSATSSTRTTATSIRERLDLLAARNARRQRHLINRALHKLTQTAGDTSRSASGTYRNLFVFIRIVNV